MVIRSLRAITHGGSTLAMVVAIVLAWEAGVRLFGVAPFLLPGPLAIAARIARDWAVLLDHAWATAWEVLLGFGLSVALGVPIAIGIVYSPPFERLAYGLIVSSQTVPKAALAPIIVVWLGYGIASKVAVAFLIAFFPIVINTVVGMRSVEPEMIHLARSLGASPLQIFLKVRLPKALPATFGGLKVAMTLAVVGAVIGEFIAANKGLGYVQLLANGNLDTVLLFATVILLSVLGIVLFALVGLAERLIIRWRPPDVEGPQATM